MAQARAAEGRAQRVFAALGTVAGIRLTRVGDGYGVTVNVESTPPAGTRLPDAVDGVAVPVEMAGRPRKQ